MKLEVDITCPGCERKFKVALAKMKPGNTCTCPGCQQTITFRGDNASNIQDSVDKGLNDLDRALRDATRRLQSE